MARYHFHELKGNGRGHDVGDVTFVRTVRIGSESERDWEVKLHIELMGVGASMPIDIGAEGKWLRELRNVVSPEFRRQLEEAEVERLAEQHQHSDGEEPTKTLPHTDTDAPKGAYSTTLALLREGRGWKRQMARHLRCTIPRHQDPGG